MLEIDPNGIVGLARHILENERDLSDLFRVIEEKRQRNVKTGKYIVLDGNRRLTVYKILETPELLPSSLPRKFATQLKGLSKIFRGPPGEELCVVYPNRETANQFIELAHRGKQEGAGRSNWTGLAGAFFDQKNGETPRPGLDAYGFVQARSDLPLDPKFPVTTLERMLQSLSVQTALGIGIDGSGAVTSSLPKEETFTRLERLVSDVATGKQTSRSLNKADALEDYAKSLGQTFGTIESSGHNAIQRPLKDLSESAPNPTTPEASSQSAGTETKEERPRTHLIPKQLELSLENKRLKSLLRQGKKLNIKNLPDVGGIFLRVFIEWSVEEYIRQHNVQIGKPSKNDRANRRLLKVVGEMEQRGHATGDQLKGIRTAASSKNSIINMETLNGYVHNTSFKATTLDVRQAWDQLEEFMELLHTSY